MCLLIFLTIVNEVCFTWILCSFGYCFCSPQLQRKSTEQQISPWASCVPSYSSPQGCAGWSCSKGMVQKFLLPGTQKECSLRLWHQQRKPRSQSHWDKELFLVPRGVSVSLCLISPSSPSSGFLWSLWHMWQAGAARPWIPEYSSIPSVSLERCHHEKNLNKTIFFCCWLCVVPFHGFKIHLSESVQLHFVLFHHLNASSWSEEIKAI